MSKHSFRVTNATFYERVIKTKSSIIVAGENFGQGSSREQAAIIPRYLGVNIIIAKSFARLYLANMVNWGILPLVFKSENDFIAISQGDILEIVTSVLHEKTDIVVKNITGNQMYHCSSPLLQVDLNAIKQGGYVNILKNKQY
jgi:aconitate hydratase